MTDEQHEAINEAEIAELRYLRAKEELFEAFWALVAHDPKAIGPEERRLVCLLEDG
jgi:hypothetical protein